MSRNQIAPGNHEKAWNDPPQLSFNSANQPLSLSASSSNRLKMMKKRIPVPLNASDKPISPAPPCQRPGSLPPKNHPPMNDIKPEEIEQLQLDESVPVLSLAKLEEYLENISLKIFGSYIEKVSAKEDVSKRIQVLTEMWKNNQLHPEVQKRMSQLVLALQDEDYNNAWTLHQSLIVDYTADCSGWMSGMKTLITEGRALNTDNTKSVGDVGKNNNLPQDSEDSSQMPLFMNPESKTE